MSEDKHGSYFYGPVKGPVHTGSGDIYYGVRDYDVPPGTEYFANAIYRTTTAQLSKPILVGHGSLQKPTRVKGPLVGNEIILERYTLVEDSVFGLKSVVIGDYSYIQGPVFGDWVKMGDHCYIKGGLFAKRLVLGRACEIEGDVICEEVLGLEETRRICLPTITVRKGVLVCRYSLELPTGSSCGSMLRWGCAPWCLYLT